jgi:hypothetical protein
LKKAEKAYLAGIIDGEGTVTLTRHHRNETPTPSVSVANNNLELLKWIKCLVGGMIVSKKKRKAHHNDSYAWTIRQDKAIQLLKEIEQYLIIKKLQADLIIQKYKSVTHRAGKYTPEMLEKKMRLVAEIRRLNKR